ncbi:hypothetical protein KSP40_PGU006114 [Platanthera guangdongensis]|uniref:Uncharacterized protein n=1 Tax=Platanthera guangdongensis TaxID=2320717 RepID=A0ABR2M775_9ASPA
MSRAGGLHCKTNFHKLMLLKKILPSTTLDPSSTLSSAFNALLILQSQQSLGVTKRVVRISAPSMLTATFSSGPNIPCGRTLTHFQDVRRRTLLTMMTKVVTVHDSWQAFAGDSTDDKDRVFNMRRRSSNTPSEDVWLVFLVANTKEEVCDFKIIGSYHKKIYTFYKGDSSSIVAQVTKEHNVKLSKKKETFGATISANCDYAFVAALITIFRMVYGIDMTITMSLTMAIMNSAGSDGC